MKKMLCVILTLALVLSLAGCGANSSYKAVLKTMFSAMEACDAEKLLKIFPEELVEYMCEAYDDDMDDLIDDLKDSMKDNMDNWEDEYGDDIKITFEIEDEDELDEDELDELMDYYDDYYDTDLDITEGWELEIELTIEGEDDDQSEDVTVYVLKADGKWYMHINSFNPF